MWGCMDKFITTVVVDYSYPLTHVCLKMITLVALIKKSGVSSRTLFGGPCLKSRQWQSPRGGGVPNLKFGGWR